MMTRTEAVIIGFIVAATIIAGLFFSGDKPTLRHDGQLQGRSTK